MKKAIRLWKSQPVLQRRQFFQGRSLRGKGATDIAWLTPFGKEMSDADWNAGYVRCLGMRLEGHMEDEIDERGRPIIGDTLLILLNSHSETIPFRLPPHGLQEFWQPLLDTAHKPLHARLRADDLYPLQSRAVAILRLQTQTSLAWHQLLPSWLKRLSRNRRQSADTAAAWDSIAATK